MSRYRNELAGQREAIRALWGAVAVALACALILGVGWMTAPSALRIHIPPDLTAGATVRPDDPGPPHVYTFALYLWQQLYRWPRDGAADYRAKLDALAHFLTGRDIRFPSSSVKGSWSCTGKAWARKSSTYSRGVRSMERSSHSEGGISAIRRSISASPVETSCTTAERPAPGRQSARRAPPGHRTRACPTPGRSGDRAPGPRPAPRRRRASPRQRARGGCRRRGIPRRLKTTEKPSEPAPAPIDRRRLVWAFIRDAPNMEPGGSQVGDATAAVTPWPHQVRAFERLYGKWPPKLLIADEVGLGKTIQAGMLLRQAWLSGRAKRILILAPKAVLSQWQIELREKFNLNWPIYDGRKLVRYPSPALRGANERDVDWSEWHKEPIVIASSHLMRRRDRARELLENAEPWDLVVLDEAHQARRRSAGAAREGGPNALLRLMHSLKDRTEGLVLLTATPMQVHPVEVWDLLALLGLPNGWTERAFLEFFEDVEHPSPSHEAMERMAALFRSVEAEFEPAADEFVTRVTELSGLKRQRVVGALRDAATYPRRMLESEERRAAVRLMRAYTPIRHLISRHTRELLRRYFNEGMITTPIADRDVRDEFIEMTPLERDLYEGVEDYISTTYNQASEKERAAVGFVMTIYRRRLASSFAALRSTLEKHLSVIEGEYELLEPLGLDEDTPDDEVGEDIPDSDEIAELEREALAAEDRADIQGLLDRIRACPPDSKLGKLKKMLRALREAGYQQAMVFTQYTDTMRFLRDELERAGEARIMCFSGSGGEVPSTDGGWRPIDRDDAKRRFRLGEADILLCTDAAAEGLNFQFCGALVNYDMPWNSMRVEQRIGRIDRLGQAHRDIRIVNLHYEDTVETDVYLALRERIDLFETVVGRLQPILARLPGAITGTVLAARDDREARRARALEAVAEQAREMQDGGGFDLDKVLADDLTMSDRPAAPVTLDDLDRVITSADLMPPGIEVRNLGRREYGLLAPGMDNEIRVTTDAQYYDEHAENVELWTPGSPSFCSQEVTTSFGDWRGAEGLEDILDT